MLVELTNMPYPSFCNGANGYWYWNNLKDQKDRTYPKWEPGADTSYLALGVLYFRYSETSYTFLATTKGDLDAKIVAVSEEAGEMRENLCFAMIFAARDQILCPGAKDFTPEFQAEVREKVPENILEH